MLYRRLGRSGLIVSELSLGTNTFGGSGPSWSALGALDQRRTNAVFQAAIEGGINLIDTADIYGEGDSERQIGQAIRDLNLRRSELLIASKCGGRTGSGPNALGLSRAHVIDAVHASLERLGTDYLDILMLHFPDEATPLDETLRVLDDLVRAGKVRYLGCSNFAAWMTMKAIGISERESLERFVVQENHWSAATRQIEIELVPMARECGIGLLIWGPLLGGLLTGKFERSGGSGEGRTGGRVPANIDRERLFDVVDAMRPIAREHDVTVAQIALAWLLAQPTVASVLFGARSPEQVRDNLGASGIQLSSDEIETIGAASEPILDHGRTIVRGALSERLAYV